MSAREADARVAVDVKALQAAGRLDAARERFAELVTRHQRRASRIAFHYLRDAADADEAVQDAFVKAYTHLGTFREELPFEVWFTRILINGCLDRLKMRKRREQVDCAADRSMRRASSAIRRIFCRRADRVRRNRCWRQERREQLNAALAKLPERQRLVFMLSHFEGRSSREVSGMTGLNESTVRVHLFRAIRRLRGLLAPGAAAGRRRAGGLSRAAH